MKYVEKILTQTKEDSTKSIVDVLNSKAMDALSEMQDLIPLNEIMGYIKHGNETIATNGVTFKVGMKLDKNGRINPDEAAHFDNEDDAKRFIDGGKKGPYSSVASTQSVKKAINPPNKLQPHERDALHKKLGLAESDATAKTEIKRMQTTLDKYPDLWPVTKMKYKAKMASLRNSIKNSSDVKE